MGACSARECRSENLGFHWLWLCTKEVLPSTAGDDPRRNALVSAVHRGCSASPALKIMLKGRFQVILFIFESSRNTAFSYIFFLSVRHHRRGLRASHKIYATIRRHRNSLFTRMSGYQPLTEVYSPSDPIVECVQATFRRLLSSNTDLWPTVLSRCMDLMVTRSAHGQPKRRKSFGWRIRTCFQLT